MHVDGMQSPCHKREGSPNIEMQTPVKRSKSIDESQVCYQFTDLVCGTCMWNLSTF